MKNIMLPDEEQCYRACPAAVQPLYRQRDMEREKLSKAFWAPCKKWATGPTGECILSGAGLMMMLTRPVLGTDSLVLLLKRALHLLRQELQHGSISVPLFKLFKQTLWGAYFSPTLSHTYTCSFACFLIPDVLARIWSTSGSLGSAKEMATGIPKPNTSKCKASLLLLSLTSLIPRSQIGGIIFLELPFLDKTNPQPLHRLLILDICHVVCLKTSMLTWKCQRWCSG